MILEGRVRVNRRTVTELGTKADPHTDRIEVDGKPLKSGGPSRYILLNKPKGYISAASDPEGRPVVTDLVKRLRARLFPVGRLDYDTEGALILTNDGELTARLLHPRHQVPKKYLVKVKGVPSENALAKIRRGVKLFDGKTLPAKASLARVTAENSWIEIIVTEGRNRLVKRLLEAVGHPVMKLRRTSFAGIAPKGLKPGSYRELTLKEVEKLKKTAGLIEATEKKGSMEKKRVMTRKKREQGGGGRRGRRT